VCKQKCANKNKDTAKDDRPSVENGTALTQGVIECANKSMQTKTKTQPKTTDQVLRTALTQGVIERERERESVCVCRVVKRGFAVKCYFAVL